MPKVIVYSTPTCPYCTMAKDYLKDNKVSFTEKDVAADEAARNEMVEKSDQMGVPVIDVDGEIVTGFDKEKLAKLLNL
ncbi:MAG: glutaredoxin domain-containing protein [Parcubacteria group bacterium]